MTEPTVFRHCSSCKAAIPFEARYYSCSVSTCNRPRATYAFCSSECQQAHSVTVNHRDAWAEEEMAPSEAAWKREQALARASATESPAPRRVVSSAASQSADETALPRDVLIVASKLKKYVRERSGMNTSDGVMGVLSDHVRLVATEAIRAAAMDERKTVLDRDVRKAIETLVRKP